MFLPLHDQNARVFTRFQFVTVGMIIANFLAFILFQGTVLDFPDIRLAFIPVTFFETQVRPPELMALPEELTLISYAFLHASWMHLIGNMLFLWVFGDNVEDSMGHFKFLIFYLICAVAGGLAFAIMTPDPSAPLVGASGATSGVIAAYLMLHPRVRVWVLATLIIKIPLPLPAWVVLGLWIVWNIWSALSELGMAATGASTAWWAHIGGLVAGAVLVPFFKRREVALFDRDLTTESPVSSGGSRR